MSLSSQNRISLRFNRERFFESGVSLHTPSLQLFVLKETIAVPQFAISISKKIAKKAHQRNKIRRQIQQLIQSNISSFPPYKYLFIPKKTVTPLLYSEISVSFGQLLIKLK